jgi:hypothetical protein
VSPPLPANCCLLWIRLDCGVGVWRADVDAVLSPPKEVSLLGPPVIRSFLRDLQDSGPAPLPYINV